MIVGLKKVSGLLQIAIVKGILHKVSDSSTQIAIAQKSTSQMLSLPAARKVSLQKCRKGFILPEKEKLDFSKYNSDKKVLSRTTE